MNLTYEAVDAAGHRSTDAVEAADEREAVQLLRRRGLYITRIGSARATASKPSAGRPGAGVRMSVNTLALFTRQMAMLLRAGSGLVPAIAAIRRQLRRPEHAALLGELVAELEEGSTLTEALRRHPRTFDPVYTAIIAAGEASGTLTEMFDRLAVIVGKRRAMRKKIFGAMAYPALLVVMCSGILTVLLFFVLPRFAGMFTQLGIQAPGPTRALLAVGAALRAHWPAILIVAAGAAGAAAWAVRTDWCRQWLSDLQLHIPLLGKLRSRLIQGQVFRTMGMLLESRVGVLDTFDLARESTRNRQYQRLFDELETSVTSGGHLTTALEGSGLVEPYICQATRTGEESGTLGGAFTYCADVLDETNEELVDVVARLLEPVILILMGGVVGGVAISLFLPLFDLTAALK